MSHPASGAKYVLEVDAAMRNEWGGAGGLPGLFASKLHGVREFTKPVLKSVKYRRLDSERIEPVSIYEVEILA